uniref:Uncharacterized protein n=1 Tax=Arundo donax TaxID=35708 RepID=A0A0A8Z1G0_ARUDO
MHASLMLAMTKYQFISSNSPKLK